MGRAKDQRERLRRAWTKKRARRYWKREAFAAFGSGSWIQPPALVTCPHRIHIGDDVEIMSGSWLSVVERHAGVHFEPVLRIGNRTTLGRELLIACIGQVEIGPDVLVSDRVFIGDTYHDYRDPSVPVGRQPMSEPEPVRIEKGSFLGVGSIVLPGVTVGENAYVAAGAVVTKDVAPRTVVGGNPATQLSRWDSGSDSWLSN